MRAGKAEWQGEEKEKGTGSGVELIYKLVGEE